MHLPDPKKLYYIMIDTSYYAGSGCVFQKDEYGNERILFLENFQRQIDHILQSEKKFLFYCTLYEQWISF